MSTFMQYIYLYPDDTWVWTLFNPLHRSYAQSQNKTESEGSIIIITKACRLIPCHHHCCQSLDESHSRAPVSIFTLMKPMKLCIILMGPWQKCRRQRRRKLHFSATLKWGADSWCQMHWMSLRTLLPPAFPTILLDMIQRKKQIIIKSLHFMGAFKKCNLHTIFYDDFTHMKTKIPNLYYTKRPEWNMLICIYKGTHVSGTEVIWFDRINSAW